uniref:Uncharacterized protein LOC112820443 n=1 Tax=Callorhinus ursinus TaxID=34884 RepID=A0A3Q7NNU7_CALUR|nr:uncharacterized protein LOC112820443 [Callorhinus ursinus]
MGLAPTEAVGTPTNKKHHPARWKGSVSGDKNRAQENQEAWWGLLWAREGERIYKGPCDHLRTFPLHEGSHSQVQSRRIGPKCYEVAPTEGLLEELPSWGVEEALTLSKLLKRLSFSMLQSWHPCEDHVPTFGCGEPGGLFQPEGGRLSRSEQHSGGNQRERVPDVKNRTLEKQQRVMFHRKNTKKNCKCGVPAVKGSSLPQLTCCREGHSGHISGLGTSEVLIKSEPDRLLLSSCSFGGFPEEEPA